MGTAVVFAGGPVEGRHPAEAALADLAPDLTVAVDSGLDLALHLGWHADLVVGDMDSVSAAALARAESAGSVVRRHPRDKESTDLELALDEVLTADVRRVVVVGSSSGRLDHLLGAAAVLSSPRWRTMEVDAWFGTAALHVVWHRRTLRGAPGDLVSLLAVSGPAVGVRTDGLRWPLRDETLEVGSTRGISNELVGDRAEVAVREGALLAVVPEAASSPARTAVLEIGGVA